MRSVFYFYNMHYFIKNAIEKIFTDKTRNISNSIIILPNKRSRVFLKKQISNISKKTIFAPKIYDIEEFMSVISGIEKVSDTELLLNFIMFTLIIPRIVIKKLLRNLFHGPKQF